MHNFTLKPHSSPTPLNTTKNWHRTSDHKRSDSLTLEHVYTSSVSHSQPATCPAASSDASARKYGRGGISCISNVRGAPQAVQGGGGSVSARASSG